MSFITKKLVGDTLTVTWVSSGVAPTTIAAAIYNGSDSMVNSISMTSSGNGHYYSTYTIPNTPGYYVAQTLATISGKPYKDRMKFKIVTGEVD